MEMEMAHAENEEPEFIIVGDEDLNEKAASYIDRTLRDDETLVAVAGFDFETKVLVITDQRVLITGEKGVDLILNHDDIYQMRRDDRILVIGTRSGKEHRYRFDKDQTVDELVEIGRNPRTTLAQMEMAAADDEEPDVIIVGDEDLNEKAVAHIDRVFRDDETLVAVAGFDFEKRVLVITDQRVLITGEEDGAGFLVLSVIHDNIKLMTMDGRTLIIETRTGEEHRYRFGKDQTVEELVELAGSQQTTHPQPENGGKLSIEERVRFWEEQDKINQELIPRVIRQNELLTEHIAEHDSLPEVAGNAISQALAGAREEQRQQYEAALNAANIELGEQTQAKLQNALDDFQMVLSDAKAQLGEQTQESITQALEQLQTAMATHRTELNEQAQAGLNQGLAALREESRRTRKMLIVVASGAGIIGVAALVVSLLT